MNRISHLSLTVALVLVCTVLATAPAAAQDRTKLDRPLQSRAARGGDARTRVIIRLRDGVVDGSDVIRRAGGRRGARLYSLNAQVAEIANSALDALTVDPAVHSVHLDRALASLQSRVTGATDAGRTTSAARTSTAWDGSGVGVALIDSGVLPHHDLKLKGSNASRPRLVASVDFVNGRTTPYDDFGHGTHVAGIIGGDGTDSGRAYAGVAPGTSLLSLKVLDGTGRGAD